MSTATYYPALAAPPRTAAPAVSLLLRGLVFSLGATLPLISLERQQGITPSILNRIEVVDLLCLATLAGLAVGKKLRVSGPLWLYAGALCISLPLGIANGFGFANPVTSFAALAMASLYCALAVSIAPHPALTRALVAGVAVSALGESLIVLHDILVPRGARLFPNVSETSVRGTFRSTGQLGNYGYAVAGLLLTFGWALFERTSARLFVAFAGLSSVFIVFAASRRTGIVALGIWLVSYLVLGLRHASRRSYLALLMLTFCGLLYVLLNLQQTAQSSIGVRLESAVTQVTSGKSFTQAQLEGALDQFARWFPLGIGAGEDVQIGAVGGKPYEIHNGHLALIVELGVIGAIAFYWLACRCLGRDWTTGFGPAGAMVRLSTYCFLVSAALFMVHAKPQRDRGSMLLLGLAPTIVAATALAPARRRLVWVKLGRPETKTDPPAKEAPPAQ